MTTKGVGSGRCGGLHSGRKPGRCLVVVLMLNDLDRKIILALADCNMNVTEAGHKVFLARSSTVYHCKRVKKFIGLDPRNFYDLIKLVDMVKNNII